MNSFKVQVIKQQTLLAQLPSIKSVPKLHIGIQSIVCMNYPIQTLTQIINSHFDDQPCPANMVVKALKVISISLKDKELRTSIQKILMENGHKRHKIYLLLEYWSTLMANLSAVLSKLQAKTIQIVIGCAISEYCYTSCKTNPSIFKMICSVFSSFSAESVNKIGQYAKNQFLSMGCPIQCFISCPPKLNYLKQQKVFQFFSDLASSLIKAKQSQFSLQQLFQNYFTDQQLRTKIDNFFIAFPHLTSYFILNLSANLNKDIIVKIWQMSSQFKMSLAIKSAIKEWANMKQNFWNVFQLNFNQIRLSKNVKRMQSLFQLGLQLKQVSILNTFIVKQFIYNFLDHSNNTHNNDDTILAQLNAQKQTYKKIHSAADVMNDMIKSNQNVLKNDQINLMIINKMHAPTNWNKTDIKMLKSVQNPKMKPFINKLNILFQNQFKKANQKGKKIELAYHSIKIEVLSQDSSNRYTLTVTLHQLATMMKQKQIPLDAYLKDEYRPTETQNKKQELQKQVQSIVIQASIVRIIKKSKQKLKFNQLYQSIKDINISQQNCRMALNKLIAKGIISEQSDCVFTYCP